MSGVRLSENPTRRGTGVMFVRFARPHTAPLVLAVALGVAASLAVTLVPVVVGRLTDALLAGGRDRVLFLGVLGVLLAVAQTVLSAVSRARLARSGEHVVRDLRDRVAHQLADAPLQFLERHRAGELLQRSTAEIAELSAFVRESLTSLLVCVSSVLLFVVVLTGQSWELTLVLVAVFAPPALFVLHRFRSGAARAFGAEAQAEADVAAGLAETIRVRSLVAAAPPITRARLAGEDLSRNGSAIVAQMRTAVLGRWINAVSLVEGLALVALIVAGSWLVSSDRTSVGVVVTFVLASVTLFSNFSDLVALVGSIEEARTGAARTAELLTATERPAVSDPGVPGGSAVELIDVSFGYDGEPVLHGVSLTLERGVSYGIAGPSGAGKSTLAALLTGLYRPDRGTVRCGGLDPAGLAPQERAARVAFVPQEVVLGTGTLAEELRLVAPGAPERELRRAFAALGLERWLDRLPSGLETPLGSGSTLSVGERQLVGLVRVVLRDSEVLVLDEATSDVDPAAAELVEEAVNSLSVGRTVVVIAHREATLARLDHVFDVRDGRLEPR